jgi:hypothetical protein
MIYRENFDDCASDGAALPQNSSNSARSKSQSGLVLLFNMTRQVRKRIIMRSLAAFERRDFAASCLSSITPQAKLTLATEPISRSASSEEADRTLCRTPSRTTCKEQTSVDVVATHIGKAFCMANNKNPSQQQSGDKELGTFHYNPGNQSGKPVEVSIPAEEKGKIDWNQPAREQQEQQGGNEPDTFHYNPGNQSGKTVEVGKPAEEKDSDRNQPAREQPNQKR